MFGSNSICMSSSIPIILLEVIPLSLKTPRYHESTPSLSAPMVHIHLKQLTLNHSIGLTLSARDDDSNITNKSNKIDGINVRKGNVYQTKQKKTSIQYNADRDATLIFTSTRRADGSYERQHEEVPIVYLPSENPTELEDYPCWLRAFVGFSKSIYVENSTIENVAVDQRTLIRILPTEKATRVEGSNADYPTARLASDAHYSLTDLLSGEVNMAQDWNNAAELEILHNHDQETVNSLKLRMALLLSQPILIGTTANALTTYNNRKLQRQQLHRALDKYKNHEVDSQALHTTTNCYGELGKIPSLLWEEGGSLVVHSPVHGAGKSMLVQTIARRLLHCGAIHVIQAAPLFAKYGIHADAALESMLHSIVMSAAVREGCASVCIILDQLDAMLPPALSGKSSAGDAAVPVLNGIASYLNKVSTTLTKRKEFPFPSNKNPLYNLGGTNGHVMSVRVCLVGIVTCPDDGGRSTRGANDTSTTRNSDTTVLGALGGGHYRLPDPSAKTRFLSFQRAFHEAKVDLDNSAKARLPILAASAVSARGNAFKRVAQGLTEILASTNKSQSTNDVVVASVEQLETAMSILQRGSSSMASSANVSFMSFSQSSDSNRKQQNKELFATVGGNLRAKQALEDSLALDPSKRRTMAKLGFSPPTGVLLYGPPGTGKTLLAKAIAKLLAQGIVSQGVGDVGGAFISLRASDIVQAQVGNSEKLLVNAFETARTNAPSVVFIDEFQALFTERTGSGSGRLTSTLLQCLDDVAHWRDADKTATTTEENVNSGGNSDEWEQHRNTRVVVLGATNTPWMVDAAFLRPGRFDQVVHVGLPTDPERVDILNVHISKMRLRYSDNDSVQSLCKIVASKCVGFSGADLAALCRAAAIRCLSEQGESGVVEEHHFLDATRYDVTCSSSSELVQRLLDWKP